MLVVVGDHQLNQRPLRDPNTDAMVIDSVIDSVGVVLKVS
jgi:hypothetical protein